MKSRLKEGERIDDLMRNGYKIIQSKNGFRFGMDAVLLSGFVCAEESGRIIDLGTGTGIIPLLLRAKTKSKDITGLEIQSDSCDMAKRSVALNGLENDIHIIQGDIRQAAEIFGKGTFDAVVSNPPYIKSGGGLKNPDEAKAIARHEIKCTFGDIAGQARLLLKNGGRFWLVHRPERLAEIIDVLRENHLEPKRLKLVHSFAEGEAVLFLLEAVSGAGSALKIEKPLIIYKEKGVYTDEIYEVYGF